MKKGSQGSCKRYACRNCGKWFSVNHGRKYPVFWIPHIDGVPFRKLGDEYALSGKQIFLKVKKEMASLPDNFSLTQILCDPSRFCGILILDGKYIAVKGFADKIPFIYGIDYLTHDIPLGDLCVAEDELSFSVFFGKLKQLGYPLRAVVADDRKGLKNALNKVFPHARLQLCHNHYLENLRQSLKVRTEKKYQHFFHSLHRHVFLDVQNQQQVVEGLRHVWNKRTRNKILLTNILTAINQRRADLFAYQEVPDCPNTTNIIESYNSHLNGRLKTIKGFESFDSARRWLSAYLIRRRTKTLTDCKGKFKPLNKHASLELTIKKQARWPDNLTNLGIKRMKYFESLAQKVLKR